MSRDRRCTFLLDLGQGDEAFELFERMEKYRKLLGWSRKYTYLMGFAHIVSKNSDNPDLVVDIANYLEKGR